MPPYRHVRVVIRTVQFAGLQKVVKMTHILPHMERQNNLQLQNTRKQLKCLTSVRINNFTIWLQNKLLATELLDSRTAVLHSYLYKEKLLLCVITIGISKKKLV